MIPESGLTAGTLYLLVETLLEDGEKLRGMEEKSKALGRPDAAARIVDACVRLAEENKHSTG
jgi:UDP-N-acetylglucosamine:LPS N-acetylglucosamine transferase